MRTSPSPTPQEMMLRLPGHGILLGKKLGGVINATPTFSVPVGPEAGGVAVGAGVDVGAAGAAVGVDKTGARVGTTTFVVAVVAVGAGAAVAGAVVGAALVSGSSPPPQATTIIAARARMASIKNFFGINSVPLKLVPQPKWTAR